MMKYLKILRYVQERRHAGEPEVALVAPSFEQLVFIDTILDKIQYFGHSQTVRFLVHSQAAYTSEISKYLITNK